MAIRLSTAELITLMDRILKVDGTKEEMHEWLKLIECNVPCPNVQGLMYWPNKHGLGDNPTAEEIVEKAMSYKPIIV